MGISQQMEQIITYHKAFCYDLEVGTSLLSSVACQMSYELLHLGRHRGIYKQECILHLKT